MDPYEFHDFQARSREMMNWGESFIATVVSHRVFYLAFRAHQQTYTINFAHGAYEYTGSREGRAAASVPMIWMTQHEKFTMWKFCKKAVLGAFNSEERLNFRESYRILCFYKLCNRSRRKLDGYADFPRLPASTNSSGTFARTLYPFDFDLLYSSPCSGVRWKDTDVVEYDAQAGWTKTPHTMYERLQMGLKTYLGRRIAGGLITKGWELGERNMLVYPGMPYDDETIQ